MFHSHGSMITSPLYGRFIMMRKGVMVCMHSNPGLGEFPTWFPSSKTSIRMMVPVFFIELLTRLVNNLIWNELVNLLIARIGISLIVFRLQGTVSSKRAEGVVVFHLICRSLSPCRTAILDFWRRSMNSGVGRSEQWNVLRSATLSPTAVKVEIKRTISLAEQAHPELVSFAYS